MKVAKNLKILFNALELEGFNELLRLLIQLVKTIARALLALLLFHLLKVERFAWPALQLPEIQSLRIFIPKT